MDPNRPPSASQALKKNRLRSSPTTATPVRVNIFISYSHKDEKWRKRLATQLEVLALADLVEVWDDRKIDAGENWREEIDANLLGARIAVLLISADFLTSGFILDAEIPKIFDRHENAGMKIFPLIVRSCVWEEVRWLKDREIRPKNGKAVAQYTGDKVDAVLADFAREVARIARSSRL